MFSPSRSSPIQPHCRCVRPPASSAGWHRQVGCRERSPAGTAVEKMHVDHVDGRCREKERESPSFLSQAVSRRPNLCFWYFQRVLQEHLCFQGSTSELFSGLYSGCVRMSCFAKHYCDQEEFTLSHRITRQNDKASKTSNEELFMNTGIFSYKPSSLQESSFVFLCFLGTLPLSRTQISTMSSVESQWPSLGQCPAPALKTLPHPPATGHHTTTAAWALQRDEVQKVGESKRLRI